MDLRSAAAPARAGVLKQAHPICVKVCDSLGGLPGPQKGHAVICTET
jgi:hypothetical protein